MNRRELLGLAVSAIVARYLPAPKLLLPREYIKAPATFSVGYRVTKEMLADDMYVSDEVLMDEFARGARDNMERLASGY